MTYDSSSSEEAGLLSLFRSPFLLPSVIFHGLLLLLALRTAALTIVKPAAETPISVQLMEVRTGSSETKSIGPGQGAGGPKTMPKLGLPIPPRQQTGKLDSGTVESKRRPPKLKPLQNQSWFRCQVPKCLPPTADKRSMPKKLRQTL